MEFFFLNSLKIRWEVLSVYSNNPDQTLDFPFPNPLQNPFVGNFKNDGAMWSHKKVKSKKSYLTLIIFSFML